MKSLRPLLSLCAALAAIALPGCARSVGAAPLHSAAPEQAVSAAGPADAPRDVLIGQPVVTGPMQRFDTAARPLARTAGREAVASHDGVADAQGRSVRTRIERRAGAKYPLVRIEERLQADGRGGERLLGRGEMVADHLLVTMPDRGVAAQLAQALPAGCAVRRAIPGSATVLVSIPADHPEDFAAARAALAALPGAVVEPDWLVRASITPDDPSFVQQWALHNTGQTGGTADADIDAPEAWAQHTGSHAVLVGVIDTGIDLQHPDLIPNLWTNPGEIAGNGLDDDGNGYIDDIHGWNFANGNANPDDDHFHGTHVAGTIGAAGGNGLGVTGVCWQVRLAALKFLDASGGGYTSDAVEAVLYANGIGCNLTSNSWGGGGFTQALKDAIDVANTQGRLFVAAAGNDGFDLDLEPYYGYPATYDCPNIIAVAATDHADAIASFSNHGDPAVELAAPGVSILSTFPVAATPEMVSRGLPTSYASISGTSMATPHVSGALALLLAAEPLPAAELRSRLLARCDARSSLIGKVSGARRLNLGSLLDPAWTPPPPRPELAATVLTEVQGNQDGYPGPGERIRLAPTLVNVGASDPGVCTVTPIAASAGVTVLSSPGQVAGLPPLAHVAGPLVELQVEAGAVDDLPIAVDLAVADAGGTVIATVRWNGRVFAPLPTAEVVTSFVPGRTLADPQRPLVYLMDRSAPAIMAISMDSGRQVARQGLTMVPPAGTAPGAAIASGQMGISTDGQRLYVSLGLARRIQVLALPSLDEIRSLPCSFIPWSVVEGADGFLYVSSYDYGPVRRLDPVTGAVIASLYQFPGTPRDFYNCAMLRTDAAHQRLFAAETGLRTEGGPAHVFEWDVSGAAPMPVRKHPYVQVFLNDMAIDEVGGTIFTACGGTLPYGIQLTDMASGRYGEMWAFAGPGYGTTVSHRPGEAQVWGGAGSPHDGAIIRFSRADGTRTGAYPVSRGAGWSLLSNALSSGGRMLYTLDYVTQWKVGRVGGSSLTLGNHPKAVATVSPLAVNVGGLVTCDGRASTDPDGGLLSWRWDFGDGSSATGAQASHAYAAHGAYTVSLTVTDAEGLRSRTATTVAVNSPPVITPRSLTAIEDTETPATMSASDPDGDPLTWSIAAAPGKGGLWGVGPNWSYRPNYNVTGTDSFTVRVSDGMASVTAVVTVTIQPVNDPPTSYSTEILAKAGVASSLQLLAGDVDGPALTYQIVQAPASGTLTGTAPVLTYMPAAGFSGMDSVRWSASDGQYSTAVATVSIRVNTPPVAQPRTLTVPYQGSVALVPLGSDADGQNLTWRIGTQPAKGLVSGTAPNFIYTAKMGMLGADSLTLIASDGYHDSAPAAVSVSIVASNPWPEADLAGATAAGSVAFDPAASGFIVTGAGPVGAGADGGRYTWTELPADGALIARISATSGRGGLMLRADGSGEAVMAALLGTGAGLQLVVREAGQTTVSDLGAQTLPAWLRLRRSAGGVSAEHSPDGKTWTALANAALTLPAVCRAGLWADGSVSATQVRTVHSLDSTWATLGGSPARSGRVPGTLAGAEAVLRWQGNAGADVHPPVVGNGLVIVTSLYAYNGAWMKAFRLADGQPAWSFGLTGASVINPPAIADGRAFVQRGASSSDSQLWCVSAATGAALWKTPFAMQYERYLAPCPTPDGIYAAGGTYGGMYGYDPVAGTQQFFNATLPQNDQWAPAFAGGTIYSLGGGKLRAHAPGTGVTAWTADGGTSHVYGSAPAVDGGTVLMRSSSGLHAIDIAARAKRWTAAGAFTGTPALADGRAYALQDRTLATFDLASGTAGPAYAAAATLLDQPIITDDSVIIASAAQTWILDRANLTVRRILPHGGRPCLAGRQLVLAGSAGAITVYELRTTQPPVIAPIVAVLDEDVPASLPIEVSDPDGDSLSVSIAVPPQHGTAAITAGRLLYLPAQDWHGADSLQLSVSDGSHAATAGVSLTVLPVNDRPVFTTAQLPELVAGHPLSLPGWVTSASPGPADEGGQSLTYQVVAEPSEAFANAPSIDADGTLRLAPAVGWSGTAFLTVVCQDDGGTVRGGLDVSLPLMLAAVITPDPADAELAHEGRATVSISVPDARVGEQAGSAPFRLLRSGPTDQALEVAVTIGGSASERLDYANLPRSVTIPAGASVGELLVQIHQDGRAETDETIVATVVAGAGYVPAAPSAATLTLVDDEQVLITVAVADSSMGEPADAGRFRISRTGGTSAALVVPLAWSGVAVAGADYAAPPASVTIPIGATSVDVPVIPLDDGETESAETVVCAAQAGAYAVSAPASITLSDNEPEQIAIEVVQDGSEAGLAGLFRIVRTGSNLAARTLTYTIAGSAISGTDFTAPVGTVSLGAKSGSATVSITPRSDTVVEGSESVSLTLGPVDGVVMGVATATLTIHDDDGTLPQLALTTADGTAREPADPGAFLLTRSGPITAELRVQLLPLSGTATAGQDYAAIPGEVVLAPGQASVLIPVSVLDDAIGERVETVTLSLAATGDYRLGSKRSAAVSIADDEPASISLAVSDGTAGEPADTGKFTINRLGDLSVPLTVLLASDGSATPGTDHVALPGSVMLPANAASATVTLTPMDDAEAEFQEFVALRALPASTYVLEGESAAQIVLNDDELPVVSIQAFDPQAVESGDRAVFRLHRLGSRSAALTVPLTWSGSVANGIDVNALPAVATLAAGSGSVDLTITPRQDALAEPVETLTATITAGVGFSVGRPAASIELADDDTGSVAIVPGGDVEESGGGSILLDIVRTGRLSAAISVPYLVTGTATVRELPPARQVTLPAGIDRASIRITPIADGLTEGVETVIIRLAPGAGYVLAPAVESTVRITEPAGDG